MLLFVQFTLTFQWAFSATILKNKNLTEGHIDEIFDLLGPVPRLLCIDFLHDELEEYKSELYASLSGISIDKIKKLITDTSKLSLWMQSRIKYSFSESAASNGMTFIVRAFWLQSLLPSS